MNRQDEFIIVPKERVTITVSLKPENSNSLQELAKQSKRSKNELVNLAIRFAFEKLELRED